MITRQHFLAGGVTALIGGASSAHDASIWPGGRRGAVSLTYDDGLDSQLDNAAPALDRRGLKGTFFLTQENMEERVADWQAVARRGHEIADHTATHPCDLKPYSSKRLETEEIAPTESFLDHNFGPHQRLFAYPCGVIELGEGPQRQNQQRYIDALRRRFVAARAADGDPNDPKAVGRERYQLRAIGPTYDRDDPALAIAYLRKAVRWNRWAILIFHDVLPARIGEGDTSNASHDLILDWIVKDGLWCAPMGEVFAHLTGVRS